MNNNTINPEETPKAFIKTALIIALPIILQNTITIGVNMLDTIMLASYGEAQISASSLANDFINLFQILCMGMGGGAAVLTAQYWGRQDKLNIKKTFSLMFKVGVAVSLLFTFVVIVFNRFIMSIYTTDEIVIEYGITYLLYSLPTFVLMALTLTTSQVLRSMRKVKIPLYAAIISMVTNFVGNYIFIFGHFGMPEMQIAGAAIGTVIARVVECAFVLGYVLFVEKDVAFKLKDVFTNTKDLRPSYLRYSLPVIFSDMLLGLGNTATSIVIGRVGTSFVAANSIVSMIQRLCTVLTQGVGNAASTLIGNSVGNGKKEKAQWQAQTLLKLTVFLGVIAMALILISGPFVLSYFKDVTPQTHAIAEKLIWAIALMIIFQNLQSVITKGILRGGGDTDYCLKLDAVYMWIVSIPLGIITGLVLNLDPFIIMVSLRIDWIIKSVIGIRHILKGDWIKVIN